MRGGCYTTACPISSNIYLIGQLFLERMHPPRYCREYMEGESFVDHVYFDVLSVLKFPELKKNCLKKGCNKCMFKC